MFLLFCNFGFISLSLKRYLKAGGIAQVVEHLFSKCNSNPSAGEKKSKRYLKEGF
jgi:hypothetical protein